MTTIIFAKDQIYADTRVTHKFDHHIQDVDYDSIDEDGYRIKFLEEEKISKGLFATVAGAGNQIVILQFDLISFILLLLTRFFFVIEEKDQFDHYKVGSRSASILIAFKYPKVVCYVELKKSFYCWPFRFYKAGRVLMLPYGRDKNAYAILGSGGPYVSNQEIQMVLTSKVSAVDLIAKASKQDKYTNDKVTTFNLSNWK